MGDRIWAALGNILRISAIFGYLGVGLLGYRAIELNRAGVPNNVVLPYAAGAVLSLVLALLLWNLKGPLIRGNLIVRFLVGAYMLMWVISTLGFGLIGIGIVYLFTSEPSGIDYYKQGKQPKPRFSPPSKWQPTGRVGPSGATLYSDAHRASAIGILDSFVPVQVVEKSLGYARVVAATGEGGWMDTRTLIEGA
jgi:hypothetical protein